jgi:prevent-host-death family protein
MSEVFNMHAAKSNLSKLVELALAGESITIAKDGVPLVDIVPHRDVRRPIGFAKDAIWIAPDYDLDEDNSLEWNLDKDFD